MSLLWEFDAFLAATNGRPVGDMPPGVSGISIDTRTLAKGDAFFAIKGDHVDGHDYIANAMKAGAALAVVSEDKLVSLGAMKLPLVVVSDVLDAMRRLGEVARMRSRAQIIAVTGSVGKTSTKEMLKTVLAASGSVHASAASYNNHWGVPLTLARLPEDARFGVFEIGMNHAGEITPLVKMVRPHIAMITNVAAAHLGAFDTIDDIARAKAEIFTGLVPGGYGIINHDDRRFPLQRELASAAGVEHLFNFGTKRGSDFWLRSVVLEEGGSQVNLRARGKDLSFRLEVAGEHMAMNAAAVIAASMLAGADLERTVDAMSRITASDGRGARYTLGGSGAMGITVIDESYNANPASIEAALRVLGSFTSIRTKRRIAVLGDMLELGSKSKRLHEELAKPIAAAKVDLVYLCGPEMANLAKILPKERLGGHFEDREALEETLVGALVPGDVVMLKASNGLGFAKVVERLLNAF